MTNVYGGDEVGALVFDFGSHSTKVGYAGEDQPRAEIPSVVAVNDVHIGEQTERKYFTGTNNVCSIRPGKEVKYFFKEGLIDDWDLFEKMVDSIYSDYIFSESSQHPVIFTEPVWTNRNQREKITEIMFEHYNIPAFYLAQDAMLASFSCGRPTAMVLDSGAHHTTAIPVVEGHVLNNAYLRTPFGGDYITRLCHKQIRLKNIELTPAFKVKSKEVTGVGEKARFVPKTLPEGITNTFKHYMLFNDVAQYKMSTAKVYETKYDVEEANRHFDPIIYEFPDGYNEQLSVDDQFTLMEPFFDSKFRAFVSTSNNQQEEEKSQIQQSEVISESSTPTTSLPNDGNTSCPPTPANWIGPNLAPGPPEDCSYAEIVLSCIEKCDIDIRPALLNSIIIVGGNTLLPGFTERLTNDLNAKAPQNFKVKVIPNNTMIERKFASWIGGSIMASLGTFQQLWISKLEYEEQGKACLDFDTR